jgi:hypothetical protein
MSTERVDDDRTRYTTLSSSAPSRAMSASRAQLMASSWRRHAHACCELPFISASMLLESSVGRRESVTNKSSPEDARAGLDLYYAHRPRKPVVAVIYTHSHIDHYGGVKGVVDERDVKAGKVRIYALDGFMEEAVSENVYAGSAMGRRALYM